jgi:hypothetical protein
MSEPARIRQPIDLDEFERRLRAGVPAVRAGEDPLAELARLVGQDDPFRNTSSDAGRFRGPARIEPSLGPAPVVQLHPNRAPADFAHHPVASEPASYAPEIGASHVAPAAEAPAAAEAAEEESYALRGGLLTDVGSDWQHEEPDAATETSHPAHDYYQVAAEPEASPGASHAVPSEAEEAPRRSVRGVILLLSIIGAGAVGFGAAGGVRGSLVGLASRTPPIILAGGPTKVQATDPAATGSVAPPLSVLDRGTGEKTTQAKLVSNEEQPVDLSQQPKAPAPPAAAAVAPPAAVASAASAPIGPAVPDVVLNSVTKPSLTANNPAPPKANTADTGALALMPADPGSAPASAYTQFKRVKVVSVRPDGSIIGPDPAPAPAATVPTLVASALPPSLAAPAATQSANPSDAAAADAGDVAPQPADVPVPKPRPELIGSKPTHTKAAQDAGADASQDPAKAAHGRAPVEVADAADTETGATATSSSGSYAVQLAAEPNEEEARSTLQRLQRKYAAELGGHRGTFHRVKVGDKQVYRVRISSLSHEEANAICSKLQAKGGDCFVAGQQ